MACGSDCSRPPQSLPTTRPNQPTRSTSTPQPVLGDVDSCCAIEIQSAHGSVVEYQDACCDESARNASSNDNHGCCTGALIGSVDVPSCCKGRPVPCCDSSCIEPLALRECRSEANESSAPLNGTRAKSDNLCCQNLNRARDQHQFRLEALGCTCRALLALGQESCCASSQRPSLQRERSPSRTSIASCASADSCCALKVTKAAAPTKRTPCARSSCNDAKSPCADSCCFNKNSCTDACCAGKKTEAVQKAKEVESNATCSGDLEMGLAGKEHIILSVSGMTCTGCETKLSRSLGTLPSITELKTSLVLSRAEFYLDTSAQSAVEVIKHLERTTEFKCERVTNQGSSLDLICRDPTVVVEGNWPSGVIDVRMIDKKTIRVEFDAKVIGARDLVDHGWPNPMPLAPPRPDSTLDAGARHVRQVGYITLLSILLTIPVLILSWAPLPDKDRKEITFGSISLAFATIIQLVIAGPFYPKALKALVFSGVIEMDLLIVLSTSAAYIFSVIAFGYLLDQKPLSTGEFFETSTLLVTLIMVGRFIAALARQKAVESISIRSLQISSAVLLFPGRDSAEQDIDVRLLQYGDVFKVSPDSRIPTDGTVTSGISEIDESMLTGESKPVVKSKGSPVLAGSINGSGVLSVRLTRIPGDNTISTIASMVDEAKLSKPKIQQIADQVATYFVPVVLSITVIVFCIWMAVGIVAQNKPASEAAIQAITYAIAVLIVSCPCAIGLAVPMVIVIATGVAAERGVIFKSADAIEIAWRTAHVVFDKTGTLTQGKLTVIRKEFLGHSASAESLLLGLICSSKHPVSVAVAMHLKAEGVAATSVSDPKNVVGKGVEGSFAGHTLRAGNSRWLGFSDDSVVQHILSQGYTAFCFAIDGELVAVYGLEDSLREDTIGTITKLQESGIAVHVLSGDDDGAVHAVTTQIGIPACYVRSRCTPADKRDYINELLATPDPRSSEGRPRKSVVMFCGDGTNDAVALAQASIGVHMNEGTDVAKSAADVVLMRPTPAGILIAIAVSRKSIRRIMFNFGWSFVYNIFAILLAAGAFVHARIPPEFAGLGELVSVLPVVAAGILLKWSKI